MKKRLYLFAIWLMGLAALAGCGDRPRPEPAIRTVEVKVPVPVLCKAEVDVRETYSDAAAEGLKDIYDQVVALLIGREERNEDLAKVKAGITGCGGTVR